MIANIETDRLGEHRGTAQSGIVSVQCSGASGVVEADPAQKTIDLVSRVLRSVGFSFSSEDDLQRGIDQVLTDRGIPHQREVVLSPKDRIDFMLDGGVGIEVKIGGSAADLTRQVYRYCREEKIRAVIVVSSRLRLGKLPDEMAGKPVRFLPIARAFG